MNENDNLKKLQSIIDKRGDCLGEECLGCPFANDCLPFFAKGSGYTKSERFNMALGTLANYILLGEGIDEKSHINEERDISP